MHLPIISVSEMRTFRRCAREHHFRYRLLYRAVLDAETLRFGSLMHVGLEQLWKARRACAPEEAILQSAIYAMRSSDPFELAKAEELLIGYHYRWCDDPIEVLDVEKQFTAGLVNPETGAPSRTFELGGKIDAIARVPEGHPERAPGVYVVEHKTTSEDIGLGSVYWQKLRLDAQVSVYFDGARSLGHDVVGCLYDVIKKPTIRPHKATPVEARKYTQPKTRKHEECKGKGCDACDAGKVLVEASRLYADQRETDETPDEYRLRLRTDIAQNPDKYYQRGTVVRLEDEMRDAGVDTWQTARLIREAELAKRSPRNPDACTRYGRMCEFWDVCTGGASLTDESRFRRTDNPHEELVN